MSRTKERGGEGVGSKFQMSSENLDLLKVLTEKLPPVPLAAGTDESFTRYPTTGGLGSVLAWSLLNRDEIAVANFFMSKGALYPEHGHEKSKEFVIVYTGALKVLSRDPLSCVHFDGNEAVIRPGGCACFEMAQIHQAEALEDTWMVAITVPRDPGYPE